MQEDCVFCKIVKGEIPSKKVFESDSVLAFWDINPAAPIHILVVSKKHVKNLSEAVLADEGLVNDVMLGVTKVADKLQIKDGYRATTNNGESAGQIVPHFHFHVLGGWKNKEGVVSEIHT
jgi:histidine triad (HIT) family protein